MASTERATSVDGSVGVLRPGADRVWALIGAVGLAAFLLASVVVSLPSWSAELVWQWWLLAPLFYLGELAVVHIQFRREAHSFSLSEIPIVLGLIFASPVNMLIGQLIGNAAVLAINRKQPTMKFAFNLAQFAVQGAVAVLTFRWLVGETTAFGPRAWLAVVLANLAALLVANVLVNLAIAASGGRLPYSQIIQVARFASLATIANSVVGLLAVVIMRTDRRAGLLALLLPVLMFVGYRSYSSQRSERARLQSLYEATKALHAAPQIEKALTTAASQANSLLEAEVTEIFVFSEEGNAFSTKVGTGPDEVMAPVDASNARRLRQFMTVIGEARLLATGELVLLTGAHDIRQAIIARLTSSKGELIGGIIVMNRLSDVAGFNAADCRLLDTLAGQVSVSVENSRLEDSLAQVTQLKERLEALVASKDQFVASVSHELRTPLTAVIGLSEELRVNRGSLTNEELDEFLGLIGEQSVELASIIEDLLVAARADLGTLNFKPEPVVVADELAVTLAATKTRGGPAPEVIGTCRRANVDRLRFRQIVRNLLTNAVRYGGDDVRVELADVGQEVSVRVTDNGIGVAVGFEETIFEPYQSAHNAKTQPSSVGLGLAVSRQLAWLMKGDLRYLREGGRTVFELTIPALD